MQKPGKRPFAFARRINDAAEVFIPPRITEENQFQIHDKIFASTTPSHIPGSCALVVDYIYDESGAFSELLGHNVTQDPPEPEPVTIKREPSNAEIADEALQYVRGQDLFVTTAQVTSHLRQHFDCIVSSKAIGRVLQLLHEEGRIIRGSLHRSTDQSRASKIVHGAPDVYDRFVELLTGTNEE